MFGRLRSILFAGAVVGAGIFVLTPQAAAEQDHLKCYRIRDTNERGKLEVTLDNQFGRGLCTVKTRAKLYCIQTEKAAGNDTRGGRPGDFICYKLKCKSKCKKGNICNPDTGRCEPSGRPCEALPPDIQVDDQFKNVLERIVEFKKAFYLCNPVKRPLCGDRVLDAGEECDPPQDAACPGVCRADCTCPPTWPSPADHFSVYVAENGPDGPEVLLEDQFQSQTVDVGRVIYFLPPVSKNQGGIFDPVAHLACYEITEGSFAAEVEVANQFGTQTLAVSNPKALCVPSEKLDALPPPPPSLLRDHYKCYEATGASVDLSVTLMDFLGGGASVQVGVPFLFCNPVDKDGGGIFRRDDHLTCYNVSSTPLEGPLDLDITIRNQFHEAGLKVQQRFAICVPSAKTNVTLP